MLEEAQFAIQRHHHILIYLGSTLCYACIKSIAVANCTSLCKEEVYHSIVSVKQIKRDRMKKKKGYAEISNGNYVQHMSFTTYVLFSLARFTTLKEKF